MLRCEVWYTATTVVRLPDCMCIYEVRSIKRREHSLHMEGGSEESGKRYDIHFIKSVYRQKFLHVLHDSLIGTRILPTRSKIKGNIE